jgi:hypothetical protein
VKEHAVTETTRLSLQLQILTEQKPNGHATVPSPFSECFSLATSAYVVCRSELLNLDIISCYDCKDIIISDTQKTETTPLIFPFLTCARVLTVN